jgi:hypothetical protein
MPRLSAHSGKVIGVLIVTLLALSLLARANVISRSLYPLQVTVGIALAVLMIIDWWQTQRRSPFILIGALLFMALFILFILFKDLGILRDYPFFIVACLVAALSLIAYLVHRNHVAHIASHEPLSDRIVKR